MAFSVTLKSLLFLLSLLSIATFCCKSDDYGSDERQYDPAQIVVKALLCFNDKFIYKSCEESYRLTQTGNLNISPGETDNYCNGACLTETHLVLNCIDNILSNFLFYNRATVQDIRATIKAGCSYSSERGNFNVAEHLESSDARKIIYPSNLNLEQRCPLNLFIEERKMRTSGCPHKQLKEARITGFNPLLYQTEFVIYLLKNAVALERMTIDPKLASYSGGNGEYISFLPDKLYKWKEGDMKKFYEALHREVPESTARLLTICL